MSRRLPAEWEAQQAVLLTWPRADGDFAHHYAAVEANFIELARQIARFQPVWISTEQPAATLQSRLQAAGIDEQHLKVLTVANDDVWVRDHGPITVFDSGQRRHLDFRFNGWGGKFAAASDDALTRAWAEQDAWPAPVESVDWILEGGAIDTDGEGSLLTTEHCVLSNTRNGGRREDFEAMVAERLGIERVLWLTRGALEGDDTDGHIDTLARFCDSRTIAFQSCDRGDDSHHEELVAMAEELAALRTADGVPYHLVPLPLPLPIHDEDGQRLPAGYANFLVINGAVLVPTYDDPADAEALETLGNCFEGREIIGVNCRALIRQYGSLHCVTMQIPAE